MPAPSTPTCADEPKKPRNKLNDADKSGAADQPKKCLPLYISDPDRWKKSPNRFNQREAERLLRAAKAEGAHSVKVDPATGIYTVILPGGADAADPDTDLLSKL